MPSESVVGELAEIVGRIRGLLLTAETAERAVQLLAETVEDAVPEATGAGVTLIRDGHPTSTGYTDPVVARVDALQYEVGQGPCLTAWAAATVVRIDDTRSEPRWQRWCAAAARVPVLSVISAPLLLDGQSLGALKVYAARANAFHEDTGVLLTRVAQAAAVLLGHVQTEQTPREISSELARVLRARDTTQLAKGILMGRQALTEAQAQARLLELAREQDRSVAAVTEALTTDADRDAGRGRG